MKCFKLLLATAVVCFLAGLNVFGKEIKPKVLVYGDNLEAFAAALQSAQSNVPTVWVLPSKTFCANCFDSVIIDVNNQALKGGIWSSILKEISIQKVDKDSNSTATLPKIDRQYVLQAIENLIAKEGNLNVLYDQKIKKVVNNGKNVEVELLSKKKFKLIAVVDISEDLPLLAASGTGLALNENNSPALFIEKVSDLSRDNLRTLVAVGYHNEILYGYTVQGVMKSSVGNIFFSKASLSKIYNYKDAVFQFNKGQALGASAAYCAFFKSTSDKIEVRKLQTELMSFGSRLLPFVDIAEEDPNFNALQKIFLTEILPWDKKSTPFYFNSLGTVEVESVKPILQQLYSRSQLWFVGNKSSHFTVKDVIELIKVISFRSDELDEEVEKAWVKRFKFSREFDLNLLINRYEFAVLLNAYADPFAVRVTSDGVIHR